MRRLPPLVWLSLGWLSLTTPSCKVPIHDIAAGFLLADTSWFAEEETLFVFYNVSAEQGITENSVVEITYTTDTEEVDWTPLPDLPPVHTHLPMDCGVNSLCGSTSVHVDSEPRNVALRMRYHRDGELALVPETAFNVVGAGEPSSNRSLLVYGVFDEANQRVQWRGRNQFPTIRNEEATELGLRRWFKILDQAYGTDALVSSRNLYGYGAVCPATFVSAGLDSVETEERAIFDTADLPTEASEHNIVCALSTVRDATGTFTAGAVAQKNPEVRPAFSALHSPIHEASLVPFYLEPCERVISEVHEDMQRQRLGIGELESFCIDDWEQPGFEDSLVVALTDAIEAERGNGEDMILVIGINQDEDGVSALVESALSAIVPEERHRSSPRLAGAFVLDSEAYSVAGGPLGSSTLWCPASIVGLDDLEAVDASLLSCAIAPDSTQIDLGPFSFGILPILPDRDQYLEFVDSFSVSQAGEVLSRSFRTPEFAATSDHTDVGDYGVVTFLNEEHIDAGDESAFSYCVNEDPWVFVFRSPLLQTEGAQIALALACESGEIPEELCTVATEGVLPIEYLPQWHEQFSEDTYDIGLFWDFPFLLHMEYETVAAGSVSAFGFSVPFGFAGSGEQYLGTSVWTQEDFPVDDRLTQCTRFCGHPTFDSAGAYHVSDPFGIAYATTCYLPNYPEIGDSGFPLDP